MRIELEKPIVCSDCQNCSLNLLEKMKIQEERKRGKFSEDERNQAHNY